MTSFADLRPRQATPASGRAPGHFRWSVQINLVVVAVGLLILLYLLPLATVVSSSVLLPSPGVGNYTALLENRTVHAVIANTVVISLITVSITALLAYGTAYALVNATASARRIVFACVLLPLWVSVLIRNYAWIAVLGPNGAINGLLLQLGLIDQPLSLVRNRFGVVVGMVHYMLPYALLPIFAQMTRIDTKLLSVARSLGASSWQTFSRIFLPLSRPGIAAAVFITAIMSTGFYVTPAILGGGTTVMLAEFISVQISETLRWDLATTLSTLLLLATGVLVFRYSHLLELSKARPL